MSVKRCNRAGCSRVMCERYSPEYGYLCDECFNELEILFPYFTIRAFMSLKKPLFVEQDTAYQMAAAVFPKDPS